MANLNGYPTDLEQLIKEYGDVNALLGVLIVQQTDGDDLGPDGEQQPMRSPAFCGLIAEFNDERIIRIESVDVHAAEDGQAAGGEDAQAEDDENVHPLPPVQALHRAFETKSQDEPDQLATDFKSWAIQKARERSDAIESELKRISDRIYKASH